MRATLAIPAALLLFAAASAGAQVSETPAASETAAPPSEAAPPVATIRIRQVTLAFLVSGNLGGGVLTFEGREHRFSIGGLGFGGVGASRLEAEGEVWGLRRPEDIEGAYVAVHYGAVAGRRETPGALWLENASGVQIELRSRREGLALSLGGDAVYIDLDD